MKSRYLFFWLVLLVFLAYFSGESVQAQDEPIPPRPAELADADPVAGMAIYQARCASCHGATGLGDGEMAPLSINPPPPIGTGAYLAAADLATMRQMVLQGNMQRGMPPFGPGTSNPLSETDVTNVLAALYDLGGSSSVLPEVMVRGRVVNGTTGQTITEPLAIELNAFTRNFDQTVAITTTLDSEGNFTFSLTDVSPNWAFIPRVLYEGIDFSGDVFQFNSAQVEQDVTIQVYDATREDGNIVVTQWHIVADIVGGVLRLGEVFIFVNQGDEVYVGAAGDPMEGTLRLPLPPEVQTPIFQRGFTGAESFLPANELRRVGDDWVDLFPLYPDGGGMILLAQYDLAYPGSLTLERPVYYAVQSLSLVLPQGVTLDPADGWGEGVVQNMGAQGTFVTYRYAAATPGSTITMRLSGEPVFTAPSNTLDAAALGRNENNELFIGVLALAAVLGGAFYFYRSRQAAPALEEAEPALDKEDLLQAIAELDDQYEDGELSEAEYLAERQRLKVMLLDLWDQGG